MSDALLVTWLFLGAAASNIAPVLASRVPILKTWQTPLDGELIFRGKRLFGKNKTWRGLLSGITIATLIVAIQQLLARILGWHIEVNGLQFIEIPTLILGPLLGIGPLVGDAVESFFKRQINIPPGKSWFPFDQIDYIIGGLVFTWPVIPLTLSQYLWVFIIGFGGHLAVSYLGYLANFKDKPI